MRVTVLLGRGAASAEASPLQWELDLFSVAAFSTDDARALGTAIEKLTHLVRFDLILCPISPRYEYVEHYKGIRLRVGATYTLRYLTGELRRSLGLDAPDHPTPDNHSLFKVCDAGAEVPDASRALLYECEAIAVTAPNEQQRVFSLPLKKASDRVADLTALLASPEWADLTALKGALGGAAITEPGAALLRHLMVQREVSERALWLADFMLHCNVCPGLCLTYKREVLAPRLSIARELFTMQRDITAMRKDEAAWYHMRWLSAQARDLSVEAETAHLALQADAKNMHAWLSRRRMLLQDPSLSGAELRRATACIEEDVYNNSGWHHRHFIITHSKGWSEDAVAAEIAFTFDKIRQAPANESGWNYLLGLPLTAAHVSAVKGTLREMIGDPAAADSAPMLAAAVHYLSSAQAQEERDFARALCERLVTTDIVREKYWMWRAKQLGPPAPPTY